MMAVVFIAPQRMGTTGGRSLLIVSRVDDEFADLLTVPAALTANCRGLFTTRDGLKRTLCGLDLSRSMRVYPASHCIYSVNPDWAPRIQQAVERGY
jgi:hypothetical protein